MSDHRTRKKGETYFVYFRERGQPIVLPNGRSRYGWKPTTCRDPSTLITHYQSEFAEQSAQVSSWLNSRNMGQSMMSNFVSVPDRHDGIWIGLYELAGVPLHQCAPK